MKKFLRIICAAGMIAVLLTVSSSFTAEPENASVQQTSASLQIPLSDGFSSVLQNSRYILYYNSATNEIALQSRLNDSIFYSNPQDRGNDSVADAEKKNNLSSQFILYYYKDQVLSEMNSYYYSTSLRQSKAEVAGDELHVTYSLGQQKFTIDQLPQVISGERMEKDILPKLDNSDREELLDVYTLYSREELSKEVFDAVKNSFPVIAEHDIYIRSQIPDYIGEKIWNILEKTGYTLDNLQRDCDENQIENTYTPQASFTVKLIYRLNENGFSVSCNPQEIEYAENFKPVRIEILPFFGASGTEDTGYMLVPDGSGALIYYNNGKKNSSEYWRSFFGDDSAISLNEKAAERSESLLPVFASSGQSGGFLATVDSGYENAGVAADVSGKVNSYNYVRAFFDIFSSDVLSIGESTANNTFLSTADKCFSDVFTVSYYPVFQNTSYDEFAVMYRDLLIDSGVLVQKEADNTLLNLELIGTVAVKKKFLGFPYDSISAVTTFEQALDIAEQLGLDNIDIKYTSAMKGGLHQSTAISVQPVSILGGRKELQELQDRAGKIYFSYYATRQKKSAKTSTARTLGDQLVKRYEYNLISRQYEKNKFMYQLSTAVLDKYADKILNTAKKSGVKSVNILDIGYELNSDFNKKNVTDTASARKNIISYMKKLSEQLDVSVEKGGIYSLTFADKIWNIPTADSGYNILDESVPFYALVVRGSVPIVTSPVNTASDPVLQFLRTAEIGAQLQYSWLYEYADNVYDSNENYSDRDYRSTIDQAIEYAGRIKALSRAIGQSKIVSHQKISDILVKVVYDCGVTVLVNYDDESALYNGASVPAKDFVILS